MNRLGKNSSIYLTFVLVLLIVISLINKNYGINALFFISLISVIFITKSDSFYENIYYTLLVSSVFEYSTYFLNNEKIYYFHIILVICAATTLVYIFKNKRVKVSKKLLMFYVIWFIYICVSFIWSKNKSFNLKYIVIYGIVFTFLFIVVIFNTTKEKFYNTLKAVGFLFVVTVVIGILESLLGNHLPIKHYYDSIASKISLESLMVLKNRPVVFFYNTNNFATFLSMGIPFFMYLSYSKKGALSKAFYIVITLAAFTALSLTNSRATILAIFLIVFVYSIVLITERKYKALLFPIVFVIAFSGIYKYNYILVNHGKEYEQKMAEKMHSISKISDADIGEEGSENVRATIIYNVFNAVIKEKRLLGLGAGNTMQYLIDKDNTHGIYSVHGLALEILGDFGVFFFVFYGVFYLYLLYKLFALGLKNNGTDKYIAFSLFTALAGFTLGSFSPSSVTYFFPNYLLFALAISFIQINLLKGKEKYE